MIKSKKGNITAILLPIMFMIFISIIIAIILVYFQICIYLYDVKLNTFYIVQSSISKEDYEKMAYRDYLLSKKTLKDNINMLLEKNYLNRKVSDKGIVYIQCYELQIYTNRSSAINHTDKKYSVPVICVKYKIRFNPLISILKKEIEIRMHEDIKLSLLEFK